VAKHPEKMNTPLAAKTPVCQTARDDFFALFILPPMLLYLFKLLFTDKV